MWMMGMGRLWSRESLMSFVIIYDITPHSSRSARLLVLGRLVRVVFWVKIFYEQKSIKRYIRSKVALNHCILSVVTCEGGS